MHKIKLNKFLTREKKNLLGKNFYQNVKLTKENVYSEDLGEIHREK